MKKFFAVACSLAVGLIVADGGMADLGKGESLTDMTVAQNWGKGKAPIGKGKRQSAAAARSDKGLSTATAEQPRRVFFRGGSAPFPEMIFGLPRAVAMRILPCWDQN